MDNKKVILIILDGFGEGKKYEGNAIANAHTPAIDELRKNYPISFLRASGNAVGIPEGTQGGSEVGHFTIGAGRITFQSLEEINQSIKNGNFFEKKPLKDACDQVKKHGKAALHLLGMISDQGIHAHLHHLFALLEMAKREKIEKVFIHAVTDGRDVPEKTAQGFIKQIEQKIQELGMQHQASIATIIGRYFAMDRDNNWDRTQKAYDLYTLGQGTKEQDSIQAIDNAYARGAKTDYYIDPIVLNEQGVMKNEDAVIFWNFRTDRARQITQSFTEETPLNTHENAVRPFFVCMGDYSKKAPVVFEAPIIQNNLGEIIEKKGLRQFRIAETEKYAHVTYFFNSQVEKPFPHEERLMIDSPKCPSYAEKPEMSAREVTTTLLPVIESQQYDLIVLNFANCDLVGHSGNYQATVKAVEVIDECLGRITQTALANSYETFITGDHGNAEYMIYDEGKEKGQPCPSHTRNPVPLILVSKENQSKRLEDGELQDVAPTILYLMNIDQPKEMTGKNLLKIGKS